MIEPAAGDGFRDLTEQAPAHLRDSLRVTVAGMLARHTDTGRAVDLLSGPLEFWFLELSDELGHDPGRALAVLAAFETHAGLLDNRALSSDERLALIDFFLEVAGVESGREALGTWSGDWARLCDGETADLPAQVRASPRVAAAAALAQGPLRECVESYAAANVLLRALVMLPADLASGRRWNMVGLAAGISPTKPATDREYLDRLTAVFESGAPAAVAREAEAHARAALEASEKMDEAVLATWAGRLLAKIQAVSNSPGGGQESPETPEPAPVGCSPVGLEASKSRAKAYLSSELARLDSVETHRYGLFGDETVNSRFPQGLLIEILVEARVEPPSVAHGAAEQIEAGGFSYFDSDSFTLADSDSVALASRLYRLSGDSEAIGRMVTKVEEVLETHRPAKSIPVFLSDPTEAPEAKVRALGHDCGAVAAVFLNAAARLPLSDRGSEQVRLFSDALFESFAERGPAISVNYVDAFLLRELVELRESVDSTATRQRGEDRLRTGVIECLSNDPSALSRALLALACLGLGMREEASRAIERLVELQRHDGAWDAGRLYWTMNSSMTATWFTSRAVTTALCYRTLTSPALGFPLVT